MFTGEVCEKRFDDCFVGLSFPRVPVTLHSIMHYFESPATTFGLVKATRLTTNLGYDYLLRLGALPDVTSIHKQ